jgi:hypothetical protein
MEIKRNVIPGTPRIQRALQVGDRIKGKLTGREFVVTALPDGISGCAILQTSGYGRGNFAHTREGSSNFEIIDPQPSDYIEATSDTVTYTIEASEEELKLLTVGVGNLNHRDAVRVLGVACPDGDGPLIPLYNTLKEAGI